MILNCWQLSWCNIFSYRRYLKVAAAELSYYKQDDLEVCVCVCVFVWCVCVCVQVAHGLETTPQIARNSEAFLVMKFTGKT